MLNLSALRKPEEPLNAAHLKDNPAHCPSLLSPATSVEHKDTNSSPTDACKGSESQDTGSSWWPLQEGAGTQSQGDSSHYEIPGRLGPQDRELPSTSISSGF